MANVSAVAAAPARGSSRLKYLAFAAIAAMAAYVLYHNERFLIEPANPVWGHYEPFKWWLLGHGLAGLCVMVLAPMQFIPRLRQRYTVVHRTIGTVYTTCAFILAPLGLYIQYMDEAQGAARSFTIETTIQSSALMITTAIAVYFALTRQFTYHRQWIIRSYAVALVFLEVRVIMGLTGADSPFDWHVVETIVWSCTASSLLIADIVNQLYDTHLARVATRRSASRASRVTATG